MVGAAITTVQCTNADAVEYSILSFDPGDVELAAIDPVTGVVSLAINASDVAQGHYVVSLHCTDPTNAGMDAGFAVLTIDRIEENEHAPQFVAGDTVVDISESRDIVANPFVAQLTATDEDLGTYGTITYSLQESDLFAIDEETGRMTLTASLDYEDDSRHILLVTASNPATEGGQVLQDFVVLTVNVLDVNDEPPEFSEMSYQIVVSETADVDTETGIDSPRPEPGFFSVHCTDEDSDDSAISYSTLSDSGPFLVDSASGSLSVTADLDYESVTSYTFTVGCWDNGSPNLTSSVMVDIVVGSVNEYFPVFTGSHSPSSVLEGAASGLVILQVTATDEDDGPDGEITYTIDQAPDPQFLGVNLTTGEVYVAVPEELDFDALNSDARFFRYDFSVRACNAHLPTDSCPEIDLVIFIIGENESPPEFSEDGYSATFPENTPASTTVTTASCSDSDRGTGSFCSIHFHDNVESVVRNTFFLDSETGVIITRVALDYENQTRYGFEIVCEDKGGDTQCGGSGVMTDTAIVEVIVEPLNDNLPHFSGSGYSFNVSRTTPADRRTVGVASASDADQGSGGDLQFSVESNGHFDITDEGEIQIFNSVFNVSSNTLDFVATVSDGENSDTALVVIHLTDGNLNSPQFLPGIRAIEVSELSPAGTSVISLECSDEDAGINGEIRYSITEGNTNEAFQVDSETGEVSVSNVLILPQNSTTEEYMLVISCEDRGVPVFSDLASVLIRVYQDDSLPPEFPNDTIAAFVSEDAMLNLLVTTVEAIDLDSENLQYRFEDQSVPGVFTIGISTGEVIVSAALDRETTSVYTMTVVVTESRDTPGPIRSDNASLIIYIRDVNDNTPTCSPSNPLATIPETLEVGSTILQVNCSDPDVGDNGDIDFSLSNDFGVLAISSSGQLTLNRSLSLTDQNTLVVAVLVADRGNPPRQQTIQATVFISSVNRNVPMFTNLPTTIQVSEAQAIQTVFFSVDAEDPDRGSFGEVTYSIVNASNDDIIGIFSNTGGVYLRRTLNFFEENEYILNISAADSDFTVTELLTIEVLDANEFTPECSQLSLTTQIQEGLSAGQVLSQALSCTDDDIGSNGELVFTISSGNEDDTFEVFDGGSFRTLQVLDFDEGTRRYELAVNVSDSGTPPRSIEVNVVVLVEAVNEFSPELGETHYTTSIVENAGVGVSVLQLTATDGDSADHAHGSLQYQTQGLANPVFSISSSGLLQVAGELDREEESSYSFTVVVSDQGTPPRSDEASVMVTVTDIDDNPPMFTQDIYVATLNGTTVEGTHVITVECTDIDEGINAGITYNLVTSDDTRFFSIDASGMIQVDEDLPISDLYSLSVTCSGLGPGNFSDTTVVSIQVLVETNITFHPSSSYFISVPEDSIAGVQLLSVRANSSSGAQLYYSLVDSTSPFAISATTGALQLRGVLDHEVTRSYTLQVRASDNGSPPNFGDAVVQVAVVNVNDETPVITTEPTTITIPEEEGLNLPLAEYSCMDSDEGTFGHVSFVIRSGSAGQFSLSSSGTLQLVEVLDYEEAQSYTLEVACEDGGDPPNSDTITVPITVTPINDNPPTFPSEVIEISVTENLPSGSQVGTPIAATDADLSPHGDIRYSIQSGNDPRTFAIASETGQLSLVQALDFETLPSFSLVVLARDSGGQVDPDFPVLNDTVIVMVTVLDYNDNAPHFDQETYSGTISEEAQDGDQVALVPDISCTDADSGENGEVTLSIVEESPFTVQSSGLVTVSSSELLDFEMQDLYILTVQCRDGGVPQQASTVDLVVTVQDVNEFGPEFNTSSYAFQVSESASVGSTVGQVFASDQDAGEAGTISYSLRNMSGVPFDINPSTGVIALASSLDYETQPHTYILQVEASDASGLSELATVIVEVENEDDNMPTFTQAIYYEEVRENAAVDTLVGEVSCSDADDAADGLAISYAISDASVPFTVDGAGRVTVSGSLDLESVPRYTFHVNCSDSAQNTEQATLTINLLPFNDFAPVLLGNPPYSTSIAENPAVGSIVFRVEALDDDQTLYNEITYSIDSGNEAGRFSIDPASGVVTTAETIDREEQAEYVLGVVARNDLPAGDTSGSLPLSSSTALTVTITDINDNTPSISPSEVTVILQVSVSANATVVDLDCTDADAGPNGETEFSITSLQHAHLFELSDSGVLSTTDTIEEDVVVTVVCSDNGVPQRSSSALVVIETVSMNDHDPVFPGPTVHSLEVREDAELGEVVGCFTATDADGPDTPDGTLEYTLTVEGDDDRFGIQRGTGCVYVALALDYDENNFYRYTIEAEDMGEPSRSATITVLITLLDVVRDPPVVVGTYTRTIPETVGEGTLIVDFLCEDMDDQDMVTYSITGGNDPALFSIGRDSGRIEVAPGRVLDYETSTAHTLLVQCTDTYNLTDSANVFVTVTPVNEFTPSFGARLASIPEHSIAGTLVANLQWEDLDSGRDGEVDFEILSGDPLDAFQVLSTGQLLVRGVLDRETRDDYRIRIAITDLSDNVAERRRSESYVNVTITDINDNRPQFAQEVYTFGPLGGSESEGHVLGTVSCSDADIGSNADTVYGIPSSSSDAGLFSISSSGVITVAGNLSSRVFDNITFFVQCTDAGSQPMAGTALVIVPVQEDNFFPPMFSSPSYSAEVAEDTAIISEVILTVAASDADAGVNGRVRFSLVDDFDNTFFIDASSGELSLLRSLDFESTILYELEVLATDGAQDSQVRLTDSANVTVSVTGVNEFSPFCPDPIYVTIINRTTTGVIVDLGCLDDDAGRDGELSFFITSGNAEGFFTISQAGVVSVPTAIAPNDEREQYALRINVSDSGEPAKVTEVELIAIYSFDNQDTPSFNQSEYTLSVSEGAEIGTIVTTITATDSDPSLQGDLVYSLVGVSAFRVDSANGDLFLSSPLDYESVMNLVFTVVARDSDPYAPLSGSAQVRVAVLNENDNSPQCTQQLYSSTVLSTAANGDSVLTLNCSDADGNPITFSAPAGLSLFAVNTTTGGVSVAGELSAGMTTVFDVSVTDGERSTEVSVSVGVRFANTEAPAFSQSSYTFSVSEDSPLLAEVGSLSASDVDSSDLSFSSQDPNLSEFYVSPTSGVILLTTPLDYEATTSYSFDVVVRDSGSHDGSNQLSGTATVTVIVENTNDNSPQFSDGGIYGAVVSKTTAVGMQVLEISCTDRDASPYGSPAVTGEGFTATPFELVSTGTDYAVRVAETLLDSAAYFINITCTDGGGQSEEGQVFVFVPEPDAPTFSLTLYEWLLSENTPTGTEFTGISATSSDMSEVSYDIVDGNTDNTFYIDPSSGVVTLAGSLDYEMQQTHGLIVRARDGESRESRVLLLVEVLDINDQVPLTPPSARLEVNQSSPVGYPFGTLECSDGDSSEGATSFNFTFIPASDLFSVDQFGVVRLEGELDATPVHVLPVICYDTDMPDAVSTGIVTVEVVFVNEDTPEFEFSSYVFSVREDVATLSLVGSVQASDSDVGSYGEVSYSIADGNPDKFYIEASSGQIGLLTSLDRETTDSYSLTVVAVDGGSSAPESSRRTGTTSVLVQVEDANDNTPTPEDSSYVESITTDHPLHSPVLSVICSDGDLADAGTIDYSLNPPSVPFSIQTNGTVLLDEAQTDQTVYNFDVVCTDRGAPPLSSSALVTVIVDYVQLEAPVFDSEHYNVTVSENEPIQTTILRVHATPSDASVDIGYQLESGDDGNNFQVDPSSGDVIIRSPLDAGVRQHYTLTIRATNTGRSPLSSFTTVDVAVTDVNDHSPQFSSPFYVASVTETDPLLTPVTRVECTDEDITAEISYSISGGQGARPVFNITQEGVIATSGEIDYEEETVYNLIVMCSDGGPAPRSVEATVRVEILPVNEFLPSFLEEQYEFIAEENSFGAMIGTVAAQDGDAGSQGEVTYLLQDPGNFSVVFVGPSTGEVLVSNNLDFETQSFWNLTIIAEDGAGAQSFVPLFISVTNLNDVLPVISPATSTLTLPHDTAGGFPLQTYSCSDGDLSSTTLSIAEGNDLGYFTLNSFSQLEWTGMAEDLLTSIVVSLSLECVDEEASDQRAVGYTAVTIQVGDLLPPEFSSDMYEVDVREDTAVNTTLVTVAATQDGHTIEYGLDDLFSSLPFSVNTSTGAVTLASQLNRETASYYVFPVQATDVETGAVGVALVAVTVTDINDNRPVISPEMQVLSLTESLALDIPFAIFQCTDPDEGDNGDIVFSLTPSGPFTISAEGQVALSSALNYESQARYNVTVTCSDSGLPPETSTAFLVVEVIGANEHPPAFSSSAYNFSMSEGEGLGYLVGVVSTSDADEGVGGQLQLELVGGNGVPFFSVNTNGEIRTTSLPTNATQSAVLDLVVQASDGLLSDSAIVLVGVADVNEPPRFPSSGILALWATSAPVGGTIVEVLCFDTDTLPNAILSLSLHTNPSNLSISLQTRGSTGTISGAIMADGAIHAGTYTFSLLCSDGALDATADVTLRVEGVNNPPTFEHGDLSIAVLETTAPGTPLVVVSATDDEGSVSYQISSGTGLGTFAIDPASGEISLGLSLDYEVTQDYSFTVSALDSSPFDQQSSSVEVFVFVTNVNDVPPSLTPSGSIVLTLSENSLPLTLVREFVCTDPEGGVVTFSLTPPFNPLTSPFGITQAGVVQLEGPVDYEQQNEYHLTVTCTDRVFAGGDSPLHQSSVLIVHLTPENNFPPEFVSPGVFEVLEDAGVGSEVGRVEAIDQDNRGHITYALLTHLDTFLLGSESGLITLREGLDFETVPEYQLMVEASDNDNEADTVSPRTTTTTVTVAVTDVNDNSPACEQYIVNVVVLTGTYNYRYLAQILCSDEDSGQNSLLIYSFIDHTPTNISGGGQLLLNSSTGELGLTGSLSVVETVVVDVNVSDSGQPRREARVTVTIQVQSSSATVPRFIPSTFNTTIPEDTAVGSTVFPGTSLLSTLFNPNSDSISFTLRLNEDHGRIFIINSVTGDITLTNESPLDYDRSLQEYNLIVEAFVGTYTPTAIVSVFLTDVNDNAPQFGQGSYHGTVVENQPVGTLVVTVSAADDDSGSNGEFRYSITSSNDFTVDPDTGEVTTLRVLDREIIPQHSVTVRAVDFGSPSQTSTAVVSITVGDENDWAPSFLQDLYIININNVSPPGTQLLMLGVEDRDEVGVFAFRIITTEPEVTDLFTVDSPQGVVRQRSVSIPDDHQLQYRFIVEVNDGIFTATTDVIINIITVTATTLHILENEQATFDLRQFLRERGFNISEMATFDIISGDLAMDFSITTEGILFTNGLDRESMPFYTLAVNMTDPVTGEVANILVEVVVVDVNDHGPVFPGPFHFSILEDTYSTLTLFGRVEATDFDEPNSRNARLDYSLLAPNRDGFSINSTGFLFLIGTFDREEQDQFSFSVRAQDFGEPSPEIGYGDVVVTIVDRNDNNPQFVPVDVVEFFIEVSLSEKEEVPPGAVLSDIIAALPKENVTVDLDIFEFVDPDTSDNLTVSLTVLQGQGKYKLEREEGSEGRWQLVTTDYIKLDDSGTVLQITLTDQPLAEEDNPVIRNITIQVIEVTEEPTTEPPTTKEPDTPQTGRDSTESPTSFFTSEIGIAVIVVIVLVFLAVVLLLGCLVCYGYLRYKRRKDPLRER